MEEKKIYSAPEGNVWEMDNSDPDIEGLSTPIETWG